MKRVLLVSCGGLGNGGVQAIIMGIVRGLSRQFTFDILLFTSESRFYDKEFLSYGGKIFRIPHYEGGNTLISEIDAYVRDFYIYKKTLQFLKKEEKYDILHCHKEFESAPILRAAKVAGIPLRICHSHVINQKCNLILRIVNRIRRRIIIKNSNYLIGCSIESCDSLFGECGFYKIINNFYDDEKFYIEDNRKTYKDLYVITQVGSISRIKNQIFSVLVLEQLLKLGVNAKLNIVGFDIDKTYKQELLELVHTKDLKEFISFLPGDCNIPNVLRNSSAFIMPSLHEGFGIALIEAQAMHLWCYASTGIPSTVNCGCVSFLSLESGPKLWASHIQKMINNDIVSVDVNRFKKSHVLKLYNDLYNNKV